MGATHPRRASRRRPSARPPRQVATRATRRDLGRNTPQYVERVVHGIRARAEGKRLTFCRESRGTHGAAATTPKAPTQRRHGGTATPPNASGRSAMPDLTLRTHRQQPPLDQHRPTHPRTRPRHHRPRQAQSRTPSPRPTRRRGALAQLEAPLPTLEPPHDASSPMTRGRQKDRVWADPRQSPPPAHGRRATGEAIEMRIAGMTHSTVAAELGYASRRGAAKAIEAALSKLMPIPQLDRARQQWSAWRRCTPRTGRRYWRARRRPAGL